MKRKGKFLKDFCIRQRYLKKELSRLFFKANNLVYASRRASLSNLVNRCFLTGSSRSYIRQFGMSRQTFRFFANKGYLPGVRKSSW